MDGWMDGWIVCMHCAQAIVYMYLYAAQAFSFETGHFWPVKMAPLAEVCTGHKWPALPPNSKQTLPRLAATLPHMTRLWPAFTLRHGPLLARLVFLNEKACV